MNLTDCTFMIPYKFDSQDRAENMELCREYLDKHFKTNILIEVSNDTPFHRTKLINKMAKKARTPIIINYDCDVFIDPEQILKAVELIRNGEADLVYPYDGRFARVPRTYYKQLKLSLNVSILEGIEFTGMGAKSLPKVGGCVVHDRNSFLLAGGENENFISWGHEDKERKIRFEKLGFKVSRVDGVLYHLDHEISTDSSPCNPYYVQNASEYRKVKYMNTEDLKKYVWDISGMRSLAVGL